MQIVKAERICPALKGHDYEIAKAYKSIRISEMDEEIIFALINSYVVKEPLISGVKINSQASATEQSIIVEEILKVCQESIWLTDQDLKFILEKGMTGMFGEYYGLNAKTARNWIKTYRETLRAEALKKQIEFENQQAEKEEAERLKKTVDEAIEANRRRLIEKFNQLKARPKPVTWESIASEMLFDTLWYTKFWNAGIIDLDNDEKQFIFDQERAKVDQFKTRRMTQSEIDKEARANCLSRVFRLALAEMVNSGKDIEEILKEKGL